VHLPFLCCSSVLSTLHAATFATAAPDADSGDRPVYALDWAAKDGVVPLATYPYTPRTGDCQSAFDSRRVAFAAAETVDLSSPGTILQVTASVQGKTALLQPLFAKSSCPAFYLSVLQPHAC
jgi:hypothetical protein